MDLLDERRRARRRRQQMIRQGRQPAAALAGEGNGGHTLLPGCFKGGDHVGRIAGRADTEQDGARFAISLHLAGENGLEPWSLPQEVRTAGSLERQMAFKARRSWRKRPTSSPVI